MKRTPLSLSLPLLALLGTSCAGVSTALHGGTVIAAQGIISDSLDTTVNGNKVSTDLSSVGLRLESFTTPNASYFVSVNSRSYDYPGFSSDANELRIGGRYYFAADQPLQPFLQADFYYGDGLDFSNSPIDADSYAGIGGAVGGVYFIPGGPLLEAGVRYETTLRDPELGTVKYEIDGVSAWVGLGMSF